MEANDKLKSGSKKLVQALVGVLVLGGIIAFAAINQTNTDGELMSQLFLIFFGFIITVQIVPGLVLFGAMLKGICGFTRKEAVRK